MIEENRRVYRKKTTSPQEKAKPRSSAFVNKLQYSFISRLRTYSNFLTFTADVDFVTATHNSKNISFRNTSKIPSGVTYCGSKSVLAIGGGKAAIEARIALGAVLNR